jgi:hypothetical protein
MKIKPESNNHVHKSNVTLEKILDYYYYYYYYAVFLEILYFTYVSKMVILMCVSEIPIYKSIGIQILLPCILFCSYGFERQFAVITVNDLSSCSAVVTSASSAVSSV